MTARLGILLSGSGSTYANLEVAIADGRLPASLAVVVASRAEAGGLTIARQHGRAVAVASDPTAVLLHHGAEWVVMCGWLRFWDPPPPFAGRTFNIHPSLLPHYGGKGMYGIHVHRAVLAAGERESGCTVHLVSGDYDSGRNLGQERVPVLPDDTPESLQARVQVAERACYPRLIAMHLSAAPR